VHATSTSSRPGLDLADHVAADRHLDERGVRRDRAVLADRIDHVAARVAARDVLAGPDAEHRARVARLVAEQVMAV
jgi:hypothetical protein